LGSESVNGRKRSPRPAASIMAFMMNKIQDQQEKNQQDSLSNSEQVLNTRSFTHRHQKLMQCG